MNEAAQTTDEVIIRPEGRAGRLTLNRPRALNAVTLGMIRAMRVALEAWRDDPGVELVILDGAGERGLASGGDLKALYEAREAARKKVAAGKADEAFHRIYWREEYALDYLIARYPKPFVALMDGIVMGGGIGLSAHARHRVVTERSRLAMPETAVGLVTDVGGSLLLARAPGAAGLYLGLTGERMAAADAIYAGFADHFVVRDRLGELVNRLVETGARGLSEALQELSGAPGPSVLEARQSAIDRLFSAPSVEEICHQLRAAPEDWARPLAEALAGGARSPLALKATHYAIQAARRHNSLAAALALEYRMVCRLFEWGEFIEGIRALVIDKDRKPRWDPPRLEDVTEDMVARLAAPISDGEELELPREAA